MEPLSALRRRGHWTRSSILALLLREPGLSRAALARRLDLTVQAVAVQVRDLLETGLLAEDPRLRVAPLGVQRLGEDVALLGDATERLRAPLSRFDVLSAVAGSGIRAGQEVGLFMEDGELVAYPGRDGPSRGVAVGDARARDEVLVQGAQGVVELRPGRIDVVRVPEPTQGGTAAVDARRLDEPGDALVGAVGTGAAILAARLGRLDLRFAAAEAALNAAQRGLDVRLYVSGDQVADALRVLEAGGRGPARVEVRLQEAPLKAA